MATIAVIDVETTGLHPGGTDRLVEVAIVTFDPAVGVISEYESLIDPKRDVGPTRIHGITSADIVNAPCFSEIAGSIVEELRKSSAIAGHNIRFDMSFLKAEFKRLQVEMPYCEWVDTMRLCAGSKLSVCCEQYNIEFDGRAHAAIHDARATTALLSKLLQENRELLEHLAQLAPSTWPVLPPATAEPLPRAVVASAESEVPSYVLRLAQVLPPEAAAEQPNVDDAAYRALLQRSLEDGSLTDAETDELVALASGLGLAYDQIGEIHLDYLTGIVKRAWADGNFTEAEMTEMRSVAELLGFGRLTDEQLQYMVDTPSGDAETATRDELAESWTGKTVCFTGEGLCSESGHTITRARAEDLLQERGMAMARSVTKKLDILVVADPLTQSGKAKKARDYGVRIMHEPKFWNAIGVPVD